MLTMVEAKNPITLRRKLTEVRQLFSFGKRDEATRLLSELLIELGVNVVKDKSIRSYETAMVRAEREIDFRAHPERHKRRRPR